MKRHNIGIYCYCVGSIKRTKEKETRRKGEEEE
jgi:hypothetical protein